jgi:4-nitrophenyl phosphatase
MHLFNNIRGLIIDMDGVLWHGELAVPGLELFFQTLRELKRPFVLATNNASLTPQQYVAKLARMHIKVGLNEILTSSMATATYLSEHYDPHATRVFVIGEDGATQPLREHGFTLTGLYELNSKETPNAGADIVVCGKDETLTWDKLSTATLNINAGAKFIGTNADTTLPTEYGLTQGNGAILAALSTASKVTPTIIGKPEPIIYQQALAALGTNLNDTIAIGDRLDTDILGAVRTGIRSLLVLSGVSTREDLQTNEYQPTWVMQDIQEVTQALLTLDL